LSWSPDGEWIAYSRNLNGDSGIFTVRADGTDNRRLTLGLVVMSPVWSPDGERILMQVRGYQGQQIHFVELDGRIANLTGDSTYDYSPVWSPDGEQIAFLSRDRTRTVSPTGVPLTQVFLMDRHGTNVRQISAINGNVFGVRWSPRGDLLALYVAEAQIDLPAWGNLYILDLTHMRLVQITESAQTNSIGDIIWSPDGTRLAYIYNPLGYSWVCVQTLGQRADCRAGDNARKSELQWLTGALLPDLPIPTATPFDPASVTPLPPALRLDKSQKKEIEPQRTQSIKTIFSVLSVVCFFYRALVEMIYAAVDGFVASGTSCTLQMRSSELMSGSCGCLSSASMKKNTAATVPSATRAAICASPPMGPDSIRVTFKPTFSLISPPVVPVPIRS
ncbi:MAG: PD40 domain-containing protein, partial [Anaerolinea sp.]|nr:PD40 domain-containing protein [Anaerolinea sp.]